MKGYSKEDIEKELNELVDKEIFRREQAEQRTKQREDKIRKLELVLEAEAVKRKRLRENEIELRRLEYNNRSSRIITQIIE